MAGPGDTTHLLGYHWGGNVDKSEMLHNFHMDPAISWDFGPLSTEHEHDMMIWVKQLLWRMGTSKEYKPPMNPSWESKISSRDRVVISAALR